MIQVSLELVVTTRFQDGTQVSRPVRSAGMFIANSDHVFCQNSGNDFFGGALLDLRHRLATDRLPERVREMVAETIRARVENVSTSSGHTEFRHEFWR
jgi:hypothetical protein